MAVFDRFKGHQEVVYFNDPSSGLRAIITIHLAALGPVRRVRSVRPGRDHQRRDNPQAAVSVVARGRSLPDRGHWSLSLVQRHKQR
jgi:hypothetical protein